MVMRALWALALASAATTLTTPAHATTIKYMASFDLVDSSSGTAVDPTGLTLQTDEATDANVQPVTAVRRRASTGGSDYSERALKLDIGTSKYAYVAKPANVTLNDATVCVHVAVHIPSTLPATPWKIAKFMEGSTEGCNFRLQTASSNKSTIKAYYGANDLSLTSREATYVDACSGSTDLGCFSAGSDCPSGNSCSGDYWAELEMCQTSLAATSQVACDLYWHGRPQWATTYSSPGTTPGNVTDVQVGLPGTESASRLLYLDDLVVAIGGRTGRGWVGMMTPTAVGGGGTPGFTESNCGAGAATWFRCVDDYASGGQPGSGFDDILRTSKLNKGFSLAFNDPTSLSTALSGLTVPAIQWAVVGYTSNSGTGTWTLENTINVCPGVECTPLTPQSVDIPHPQNTVTAIAYGVVENSTTGPWDATALDDLQFWSKTTQIKSGEALRLQAVAVEWFAKKTDPSFGVQNLQDHNSDGAITVCTIGDSLLTATSAGVCSNNNELPCTFQSYCSQYSLPDYFQDLPAGGCTIGDATACKFCSGRLLDGPGGAGFSCTGDAQCPSSGTCNTSAGECNDNPNVPCTGDTDCHLGGSCVTGTCLDSCPGTNSDGSDATCPSSSTRGSWGRALDVNATNLISCGQGSERIYQMLTNRWVTDITDPASDLNGSGEPRCVLDKGSYAPCDYVVVMEGVNDLTDFHPAAQCSEPTSVRALWGPENVGGMLRDGSHGFCRGNGDAGDLAIVCDADSDCSSVSSDSVCVGSTKVNESSSQGYACIDDTGDATSGFFQCSMRNLLTSGDGLFSLGGCNANSQCGGGTCSLNDSTKRPTGWCSCTATSQCEAVYGTSYSCVGGKCRRECSTDNDCTTTPGTRTGSCLDQGAGLKVCGGRCTMPCSARTCSTDDDCATGSSITSGSWYTWSPRGQCSAGKCTNCGPEICPTANAYAYAHTADTLSADKYADMFDWMATDLTSRNNGTLIAVQQPVYLTNDGCRNIGGGYYDHTGYLRNGVALTKARGHHAVLGARNAFAAKMQLSTTRGDLGPAPALRVPTEDHSAANCFSDVVHYTVNCAVIIKGLIEDYMGTLGACTASEGTPQRYCYDTVAQSYVTGTTPTYGKCSVDTDCSGAREVCAVRPCTTNDDNASTGCPATGGVDYCNAE